MVPVRLLRAVRRLQELAGRQGLSASVGDSLSRAIGHVEVLIAGATDDVELASLRAASDELGICVTLIQESSSAVDREGLEATAKIQRAINQLLAPAMPGPARAIPVSSGNALPA